MAIYKKEPSFEEMFRESFDKGTEKLLMASPSPNSIMSVFPYPFESCTVKRKETDKTQIRNILVNEKEGLVTVVFMDGTHQIEKCSENDCFDLAIGVALAIAHKLYKSKTNFRKNIEKRTKFINTKNSEKKGSK